MIFRYYPQIHIFTYLVGKNFRKQFLEIKIISLNNILKISSAESNETDHSPLQAHQVGRDRRALTSGLKCYLIFLFQEFKSFKIKK